MVGPFIYNWPGGHRRHGDRDRDRDRGRDGRSDRDKERRGRRSRSPSGRGATVRNSEGVEVMDGNWNIYLLGQWLNGFNFLGLHI